MCLLDLDREEGTISEEDAEFIEGDSALYLDSFKDPFQHPIQSPMIF